MRDGPLTPALEVGHLSVVLGGRPIVTDIALEVPRGSWVCVIGPNGAGKTTFVHAVAGLLPHTRVGPPVGPAGRASSGGASVPGRSPSSRSFR